MPRSHSLRELYLARLREFYRQPARIFWVYGFPTILAIGLGLAFRSRPPESIQVDLVRNAASGSVEAALRDYDATARARHRPGLLLNVGTADAVLRRLHTGRTPLVVEPEVSRPLVYHFD